MATGFGNVEVVGGQTVFIKWWRWELDQREMKMSRR